VKPRNASCGLWSRCTDEECHECPQAPPFAPGEPGRYDRFEPIRARQTRMDSPTEAFAQVSDTANSAFSRRR